MAQFFQSISDVHLENAWLTIGSFDGVHRGHQEVIHGLIAGAHAAGDLAVVLTFHPHPAVVLGRRQGAFYLTIPEERAEILAALGVDVVITHPFDQQTVATSARQFINTISTHLGMRQLWVGYDFALGREREGDTNTLRSLGEIFNFSVHLVPPVEIDGEVVSSRRIRELVSEGQVDRAAHLLGHPYQVSGKVITGDGRGKKLGIPTANLAVDAIKLLPGNGVYACLATINEQKWAAASNVGVRPTFDGLEMTPHVEAHLLGFDGDIYGQVVRLDFMAHLRGEQRFSGIEALVAQIQKDIQKAKEIISVQSN